MPLPFAPIAAVALRYGAVATAAYVISRRVNVSRTDQAVEDSLDKVDEGISAHRCKDAPQANVAGRWHRSIRLGQNGPGFEIDATALGRIFIRKL